MTAHSGLFVLPKSGVGTSPTDARLALSGLIGTTSQLLSGGAITQSASTMQVTIAYAVHQLPDPTNSNASFVAAIDQTVVTPAAGPATGSRIDLICAKQDNPENGDSDASAGYLLVPGTAGAPGVAPAVPAGYYRFADINVPANAANAAACTITLRSPQTAAPLDLTCPTYALLQTVTGKPGQTAVVTADSTAAYNRMWFWSVAANQWLHSLNTSTPFAMAAGLGSNGTGAYGAITFPAGRFTVAPIIYGGTYGSVPGAINTQAGSATTSGANVGAFQGSSAVASNWWWVAVQMTPTAAAG